MKQGVMFRSIIRHFCWAGMLLVACNKHDLGSKRIALGAQIPTARAGQNPETASSVSPLDAAVAFLPDSGSEHAAGWLDDAGSSRTKQPAVLGSPVTCRVLVIGDSLSDPRVHGGGYLAPWAKKCPHCQFVNIARGGAMVNQMLRTLREHAAVNPRVYDAAIVFGGVNDLYSDQTANRTNARIERDLSTTYSLAKRYARRVFAITVAPWGGFHRWFNERRGMNTHALNRWILDAVARGEVDAVVDSGPILTCGDPQKLCPQYMAPHRDGLHFGPEGHRRLGAALLDAVGDTCP